MLQDVRLNRDSLETNRNILSHIIFFCHCVLWVCGSVRSFKTPKGPEASFIPLLWSHSGNCFWMLSLDIYFELSDAKHCVTVRQCNGRVETGISFAYIEIRLRVPN